MTKFRKAVDLMVGKLSKLIGKQVVILRRHGFAGVIHVTIEIVADEKSNKEGFPSPSYRMKHVV
ncbi:MAG: hypothetical protein WAV73_05510 [Candidatus Moraniibacteriota bacterium]